MKYRQEHPDPQWERENWKNLNGEWEFDFDFSGSARERELYKKGKLPKTINVPFCPESKLSGIGFKDFIPAVCYRKVIKISRAETEQRLILHFGAVDFRSYIYINGELAKTHIGGYSSFQVEISGFVHEGENEIFVIAEDDLRSKEQPAGKQCEKHGSYLCFYTRTTGIWQTVWLEMVPESYIKKARYYTDVENGCIYITGEAEGDGTVIAEAVYKGKKAGQAQAETVCGHFYIKLELNEIHLWEPGHGRLYELHFSFNDDRVKSYFGLRSIALSGKRFMLNTKSVFQRFVLDQGFYPDGIYTAKSDEELKRDIELAMSAGFNGARLHQKVFEKRFLYHCDKAGYLVWGEHGNWGMDYKNAVAAENFLCEWMEIIDRDFNHPSIIGWCPFNETWGYYESREKHRIVETAYKLTKQLDNTRPCIAVSGNYHIDGMEIYDVHDYCTNAKEFAEDYSRISEGIVNDQIRKGEGDVQKYSGQPVFVSEYGGFSYSESDDSGWGYGDSAKNTDELLRRYTEYTNALLDNPDIMGFCYTQLYDVEQEKNGLYTYWRKPKLDIDAIKAVNTRCAKIEE